MGDIVSMLIDYGVRIVGVLIVFYIAMKAAAWTQDKIVEKLTGKGFDKTVAKFLASITRYGILAMTTLSCLSVFGIETTSFAALIGAAGLAIGLAFQGTLSNVAAGVVLITLRPFKAGDVINAAGHVGGVDEIGLLATLLTTPDNRRIIIPNSAVLAGSIENITHHPTRRVDVGVGAAYDADIDTTRKVLQDAVATIPGILEEPAPQIFLASLGASSVDYQVRVWCKTEDYWAVFDATTRQAKYALDDAGIGIPYQTIDLNITSATAPIAIGKKS